MSKIIPIGARVAIEPYQGDEKSLSGLELSSANNATLPVRGKVLSAGKESVFKVGDILYFRRYSVDILTLNENGLEKKINMVDDADVIALHED